MTDTPLLEARQLVRHFGATWRPGGKGSGPVRAVDGVNLALHEGRSVGLVGESGCGKSTLARLLLLLDEPTAGEVRYRGLPAGRLDRHQRAAFRREVQPVLQDPYQSLDAKMRVGRIVAEPLRAQSQNMGRRDIERRTAAVLERVDLRAGDAARFPVDFSGGQRQRIAIARALVSHPGLIILDEAVASQDVSIRAQILNLLKDIQADEGVGYLFISHDLTTVSFLCDIVHVMYRGHVVEVGRTDRLFQRPAHPYTAMLLGAWLPPDPGRARARAPLDDLPYSPAPPAAGCPYAPRCARASALCTEERPALVAHGNSGQVACHHPLDPAASPPDGAGGLQDS